MHVFGLQHIPKTYFGSVYALIVLFFRKSCSALVPRLNLAEVRVDRFALHSLSTGTQRDLASLDRSLK